MSKSNAAGRQPPASLPAGLRKRERLATFVLAVFAALAVLVFLAGSFPHEQRQRLVLALLACGPVVLMRRWPLPVLGVVAAGSVLVLAPSGNASLALVLLIGLAMYFAASHLPRRTSIIAAAVTAAALSAADGYATLTVRNALPGVAALVELLPLAAAWFVGDSVAARRRYLAGLAEQAQREQAAEAERGSQEVREERVRIARELHDVVAHTLAVITVQAGVGRRLMDKRPEEAGKALESIEAIGRTAQDELRVVLGLLRDEEPSAAALAPAPRLADVKELADTIRTSGTPVELHLSGTDRPLSPALELSIYRVVQEALTNVVKHAPRARAIVDLTVAANVISLEVTDDGGGTGVAEGHPVSPGAGNGIVGMRERVTAFGGWLVAEPLCGGGFQVAAQIPAGGTG